MLVIVAVKMTYEKLIWITESKFIVVLGEMEKHYTLNRVPIDENLDVLVDSSAWGGNKLATKVHFEALKSACCSATT